MQQLIDENVTIIVKSVIGIATMLVLFGLNQLKRKTMLWIEKQKNSQRPRITAQNRIGRVCDGGASLKR